MSFNPFANVRWAQRQAGITNPVHANTLVAIAVDSDRDGACFPSQERIAAATRYSVRAVCMAIAWLERAGYLRREERRRPNGSRRSDRIVLCLDRQDNRQEVPVVKGAATGTSRQTNRNLTADQPAGDSGLTTFEEPQEDSSDPIGSAPPSGAGRGTFRKDLFERGIRTVRDMTGRPEVRCRALVESWLSLAHDDAATVLTTIDAAAEGEVLDAVPWIEARVRRRRAELAGGQGARGGPVGRGSPYGSAPRRSTNGMLSLAADMIGVPDDPADILAGFGLPSDRSRNDAALQMALRGEWPVGGIVFVAADSPEGDAWEAHYRRLGRGTKWRPLSKGYGGMMPSAMPPAPVIDMAATDVGQSFARA